MGFGIIEPKGSDGTAIHVPGTSALFDEAPHRANAKHAKGTESSLILVPEPSEDPNDPLNWPWWKKELCFFALVYNIMMGAVLAPILATVGGPIVEEFKITFPQFALLSGWPLFTTGISALFFNAIGQVWGRRPCYLIATIITVATCIWNANVKTYSEFIACRIVQGIGAGPYESVIIASIGDLFFVHQRGRRIMYYNIATLGTVLLSLIADGYVGETYGWRMMFNIVFPFTCIGLLLVIFLVPEHLYVREAPENKPELMVGRSDAEAPGSDGKTEAKASENAEQTASVVPAKKTWLQDLKPFGGRLTGLNPLTVFGRTVVCLLFPTVIYSFLVSSMWTAFNASIAVTLAQTFASKLSPTYLGYISTFPFVGTFVGFALGQLVSDPSAKWAARRNGGVFEPEFRMFLVIPGLLVGVPAYFGYGSYAAAATQPSWLAISAIFGVFSFGNVFATAAAYNYVLDAHNDMRMDVTVAIVAARNVFWWGSTQFMPQWLEVAPINIVYYASGAILAGTTALTVLFYVFGKIFRNWVYMYNPFHKLGWD